MHNNRALRWFNIEWYYSFIIKFFNFNSLIKLNNMKINPSFINKIYIQNYPMITLHIEILNNYSYKVNLVNHLNFIFMKIIIFNNDCNPNISKLFMSKKIMHSLYNYSPLDLNLPNIKKQKVLYILFLFSNIFNCHFIYIKIYIIIFFKS